MKKTSSYYFGVSKEPRKPKPKEKIKAPRRGVVLCSNCKHEEHGDGPCYDETCLCEGE